MVFAPTEVPDPPDDDPDPPPADVCVIVEVDLEGYVNTAAMLADGWTAITGGGIATWELATHPAGGNKAIKVTLDEIPAIETIVSLMKAIPGFESNTTYVLAFRQYPVDNGTAFSWTTDLDTRTELTVPFSADGDGEFDGGVIGAAGPLAGTPGGLATPAIAYSTASEL